MVVGSHLTDTNILLRVSQRNDPDYDLILSAVRSLRASGATLWYTSQNLAEFWNVCTRPARQNGYGMTVAETNRRAELIERGFTLLPDDPRVHTEWRRLVVAHAVMGVQVHDARLVAAMHVHGIERLLTLDQRDFMRYSGITVVHPRELVES
jgi:predicted nucleic acid-binding protein